VTNRKSLELYDPIYSAINPGGIRLGTPALTTRGMTEKEMEVVADFLIKGLEIAKRIQDKVGKQLKDFIPALEEEEELKKYGEEVKAFASQFSIPGV
jgi:glycine hydroxymethyltransferase